MEGDNLEGNTQEKVPDQQVAELNKKVDATTMNDKVVKVGHEALREVLKGWTGVGKLGEKNPEVMMVVPCCMKDHQGVSSF